MADVPGATWTTGRTLKAEVLRQVDGFRLDFADGVFKASGWTTRLGTLSEDGVTAGYYTLALTVGAWNDGYYRILLSDTLIAIGPIAEPLEVFVRGGVMERIGVDPLGRADVDKTGYALSAGGIQAIWDALVSGLTTVNSIGKRLVDYLTGDIFARLGAPAGASVAADVAAVKSDSGPIRAKTDQLGFTLAGKVDANALAIGGEVLPTGSVVANGANSASSFKTTLTALDTDHYRDALLLFLAGTGVAGQVKKIVSFDTATGICAVQRGYTRTPPTGATFVIINA